MAKKATFAGKSREDLIKALYEKREDLRSFNFGQAGSKTRDIKVAKHAKKDIARILTELNKK